jgi:hypothetical protein
MLCVHMLVEKYKKLMNMTKIRTYSELSRLDTFSERFEYLKLGDVVGSATFGFDRYINQRFYTSYEWKMARENVILRDNGCDLGILGFEIHTAILIHHINPMMADDIIHGEEWIFDPEYLITTTKNTHNAIHFGSENPFPKTVITRNPGDTKLW